MFFFVNFVVFGCKLIFVICCVGNFEVKVNVIVLVLVLRFSSLLLINVVLFSVNLIKCFVFGCGISVEGEIFSGSD